VNAASGGATRALPEIFEGAARRDLSDPRSRGTSRQGFRGVGGEPRTKKRAHVRTRCRIGDPTKSVAANIGSAHAPTRSVCSCFREEDERFFIRHSGVRRSGDVVVLSDSSSKGDRGETWFRYRPSAESALRIASPRGTGNGTSGFFEHPGPRRRIGPRPASWIVKGKNGRTGGKKLSSSSRRRSASPARAHSGPSRAAPGAERPPRRGETAFGLTTFRAEPDFGARRRPRHPPPTCAIIGFFFARTTAGDHAAPQPDPVSGIVGSGPRNAEFDAQAAALTATPSAFVGAVTPNFEYGTPVFGPTTSNRSCGVAEGRLLGA